MTYFPVDLNNQQLKADNYPCHVVYSRFDKCIPLHSHDFIEMAFVLSGFGKEVINGMEHELKSGSLSILLPWHLHEIMPDAKNPLVMITCSFKLEMFINKNNFFELNDLLFDIMDIPTNTNFENDDFKLAAKIFNQLLHEYSDQNKWKDIIFKVKITEILVLFRRSKNYPSEVSSINTRSVNNQLIWNFIDFIHVNYSNKNITLSYAAQKFNLDAKNLNILLKQNTGLNFNDLLDDIRIRIACTILLIYAPNYLLTIDPTLSQSYVYPGYKSKQEFLKAFRKLKGLDPEEFIKLYSSSFALETPLTVVPKMYLQIIYYLYLYYAEELTLKDISRQFQADEDYVSSLMKSQTGQSFQDLLDEIRIFHACNLLKHTKKALNEISLEVGFHSIEDFIHKFRSLKGDSPDSYRKI